MEVFINYPEYNKNNQNLTVFNIVGLAISSILLLVGSLKLKANLLIGALIYLFYKLGFIIWYLESFYKITLGCDDSVKECGSNRLLAIYHHIMITGLFTQCFIVRNYLTKYFYLVISSLDFDNCANLHVDYLTETMVLQEKELLL